jgi:septal ring factor EnvC (AmiA/AmiB activator)
LNPAPQEQNLNAVRQEIDSLQKDIAEKQAIKKEAQSAISASQQAITAANKTLSTLAQRQSASARKLAELKAELTGTQHQVKTIQSKVARMVAQQYKRGDHDAMQLMLNASDPNQASRDLTYYKHIAGAQKKLITDLNTRQQELAVLADRLAEELAQLDKLSHAKSSEKNQLEASKSATQGAVSQLVSEIKTKEVKLGQLKTDEKRLSSLIARINQEIAERKRKALEAKKAHEAAVKARAETIKAAEAKRRKVVAEAHRLGKTPPPAPKLKPQPIVQAEVESSAEPNEGKGLQGLQGKMTLPVSGQISGRFGTLRAEGTTWKGVFIRAAQGLPVHAVANGRVVYADRLRGFGNAVIVDHGGNYMTVYTGLATLGRSAGHTVKAGENLGTSGMLDSGEAGLYFEVRHLGQPINPLTWAR